LKTSPTQFGSALPLMPDSPVRLHDDQKRWNDHRNRNLGSISAKNELFLSPTPHLPTLHTRRAHHLSSTMRLKKHGTGEPLLARPGWSAVGLGACAATADSPTRRDGQRGGHTGSPRGQDGPLLGSTWRDLLCALTTRTCPRLITQHLTTNLGFGG
jgi:hypothetical protein